MVEPGNPHPLDSIEPLKTYEWYLAERATLVAARQGREDSFLATIIQISSAALLLIPGLFFTADARLPPLLEAKLLYLGILCFALALFAALTEQILSAKAYNKQLEVIERYYFEKAAETYDPVSANRVIWAIRLAMGFFCFAILLSSLGLAQLT